MFLGVVYHAAGTYMLASSVDGNRQASIVFDALVWLIHLFRMHTFFVIAGFFSAVVLSRQSTGKFLRTRALRLLLPLGTCLSVIWLVRVLLQSLPTQSPFGGAFAAHSTGWMDGTFHGPLWFLQVLALYSVVHATASALGGRLPARMTRMHPLAITFGAALLVVGLRGLAYFTGTYFDLPVILQGFRYTADYAGYYLLGVVFFRLQRESGFKTAGFDVLLLSCAALACTWGSTLEAASASAVSGRFLRGLADAFLALALATAALRISARLFWRESPTFRYLADASYTVYLVHMVPVFHLGMVLNRDSWGAIPQLVVVFGAATAISIGFHHFVVLRSPFLRLLLNGVPPRSAARLRSAQPLHAGPATARTSALVMGRAAAESGD